MTEREAWEAGALAMREAAALTVEQGAATAAEVASLVRCLTIPPMPAPTSCDIPIDKDHRHGLSVHALNALWLRIDPLITTLGQLANKTLRDLQRVPTVGPVTIREYETVLARHGLKLRKET